MRVVLPSDNADRADKMIVKEGVVHIVVVYKADKRDRNAGGVARR